MKKAALLFFTAFLLNINMFVTVSAADWMDINPFETEAAGDVGEKGTIRSVKPAADTSGKYIALTFDDGPTYLTNQILDELAVYGAKATFFILGNRIGDYAETTVRIAAEGHQIGNHSYSHKQLNLLNKKDLVAEIDKANDAIFMATGITPTILRPPFGAYNDKVIDAATERGMAVVRWSIDTKDWIEGTPANKIINHVLTKASEGDIILMHDLYKPTVQATIATLKTLTERGFTFVTVDELISRYSDRPEPGMVYENASGLHDWSGDREE
jgi:peptidoglycan/xylan/chitin deacetylase (PgdA/CDA1 family)